MPTIRAKTLQAGASAARTVFPLQGNQYEYLPFNARVEFAIVAAASGAAADPLVVDEINATVFSGSDILQQQSGITNKSDTTAQTKNAVYPDDFLLDDVAAAGERLSVQLDLPATITDNNIVVDTVVKITPL